VQQATSPWERNRLLSRVLLPIPTVQTHLLTTCNTDPLLPKEAPASFSRERSKHSCWKQHPKHCSWWAHSCWSSFLQQANQEAHSWQDQVWLEEIQKLYQVRWAQELKKKKSGNIAVAASTQTSNCKVTAQCPFTYKLTASPGHPCCTEAVTGGRVLSALRAGFGASTAVSRGGQTMGCPSSTNRSLLWSSTRKAPQKAAILLPACSEHAWGESSIHLTRNLSTKEWAEKTFNAWWAFVVNSRKKKEKRILGKF